MRKMLKYVVARTYKPLLVRYLSGTRNYTYKNIHLEIPPEVFHPGFFFSTKLLLRYIKQFPLAQKSFLELGAGSGLISIYAAQKGAAVTATDINPIAIKALKKNLYLNEVDFSIIESDLFTDIPEQAFDIIAINPPYYKKNPASVKDYAWYCGAQGEFFAKLFKKLNNYMHNGSEVLMILCDGCDIEMIKAVAKENTFVLNCIFSRKNMLEENFVYKIERVHE
ncbi:MAG: methyltransferase [Flavisolibacter sp.]|nr:methyltransferase [Flavisolibacter sp.]